ncbi:MAG: ergothioneine biosynthesis protein EgtB, partial [Candidatus Marinimicrobia bacterium]|nr:ergothioneine biosynthesis protein EgtB [Candidatus Neomarinimicrobiota bacterium]
EEGGYSQADLWLSDGWALINKDAWKAPLYWVQKDSQWFEFTLGGLSQLQLDSPVTHLSYYEADAFANWRGERLPSEHEWEHAAQNLLIEGNFVRNQLFHPSPLESTPASKLSQMFGDVWEWTRSPYSAYPGFKSASGAVGEYNGKFMSNQMVLRGGSCVSSSDHLRSTYRNFFYPHSRWQFMGLRLTRDVK